MCSQNGREPFSPVGVFCWHRASIIISRAGQDGLPEGMPRANRSQMREQARVDGPWAAWAWFFSVVLRSWAGSVDGGPWIGGVPSGPKTWTPTPCTVVAGHLAGKQTGSNPSAHCCPVQGGGDLA